MLDLNLSGEDGLTVCRRLRRHSSQEPASAPGGNAAGRPCLRVLVSVANPKLILFFLAVLPQFTGYARNAELQLALLGAVNVLSEVLLYGSIGAMTGYFHARVHGSGKAIIVLSYIAGTVYVVLACMVVAELLKV